MIKNKIFAVLVVAILTTILIIPARANDQIRATGSSTVFPYAKLVSDKFHEAYSQFKAPVIESGGTGAGIKEFCLSDADNSVDIANASRPITQSELKGCFAAGVKNIQKVIFGYDGIVLATNKKAGSAWDVKPADIYKALTAKTIQNGTLVENHVSRWSEVNKKLPNWDIEAYIPGEKHGTREVFEEKMMLVGCKESGAYQAMQKKGMADKQIKDACIAIRKDGRAIDIDGDYSESLARLASSEKSVGFFGLAFYENNADKLNVASVNNIKPTVTTVANGSYPLSRPLYFYVKKSHLRFRPGLKEYVNYFLSEAMVGDDGAVVDFGLVPASPKDREEQRNAFAKGIVMQHGS